MATPKKKKKQRKRKVSIKVTQKATLKPTTQKSNAGNPRHPTLLSNAGNIKVTIKRKS